LVLAKANSSGLIQPPAVGRVGMSIEILSRLLMKYALRFIARSRRTLQSGLNT